MSNKPKIILVLAAPGAGKSTQCKLLAQKLGLVHLSIGQILREQRTKNTQEAKQLDKYMKQFQKQGVLMPCDFIQKYLVRKMKSVGWQKNIYLIDGYLKSKYMYQYWDQTIGDNTILLGVLYYQCSKQILHDRLKTRALTSTRDDDKNQKLISIRIESFYLNTMLVINIFQKQNLVKKINGENTIEQVYAQSQKIVKQLISKQN